MTNNFLLYSSFSQIRFLEKECEVELKNFTLYPIKSARSFIRLALFDISELDRLHIAEKKLPILKHIEQRFVTPEQLFKQFKEIILNELAPFEYYKITVHNHLEEKLDTRSIETYFENQIGNIKNSFKDFEIHLRFDFFEEDIFLVKETTTQIKRENVSTGMRSELARSFALFANLDNSSRVLEPFMGSGRIIEEVAYLRPNAHIVGIEKRATPFVKTKQKLKDYRNVRLLNDDFYNLENLGEFDAIISDPPYGIQLNRHMDYNIFYERLFNRASELLSVGGKLILGAAKSESFERKLLLKKDLKLKEKWPFLTGKIRANLYIIEKENS